MSSVQLQTMVAIQGEDPAAAQAAGGELRSDRWVAQPDTLRDLVSFLEPGSNGK